MLGDSLTAGYGLRPDEALPVQLELELRRRGRDVQVVNAGISGDTTAQGLRRVGRDVSADTNLCIVALGANDMMQGLAPATVRSNLERIIVALRSRGIRALLCGMRAPPWFGAYALSFDALYPELARATGTPLHAFLLEGVALSRAYVLIDGIHPNAAGIRIAAGRLADTVASILDDGH